MAEVARRPEERQHGAAVLVAAAAPMASSAPSDGDAAAGQPPGPKEPEEAREVLLRLMERAKTMSPLPAIFKRIRPGSAEEAEMNALEVPSWRSLKEPRLLDGSGRPTALSHDGDKLDAGLRQAVQKVTKVSKQKSSQSGRTYTSKYRGVHQTFPTRRWEAQFRRNGKPTSLGCFDHEEEAAKAYDKMIIWCELHQSSSMKGGITNFDIAMYEADIPSLQTTGQDELVMMLRRDGRTQAAVAGKQAGASGSGGRGNPSEQSSRHNSDDNDDSRDTESEAEDDG